MIDVSKGTARRLVDIHGWSAAVLGLALYIVVFSGAIVVFSHEIGNWSVSGHKQGEGIAGNIDAKLISLAEQVDEDYLEEVTLFQNSAGELITFFHTHVNNDEGELEEKGTRFVLDPDSLEILSRDDGFREDMPIISSGFLERFYIDLHVRLHAPGVIGLYLTGILGLILFVSAVSGFILHRHLIKDVFLSPRLSTRLMNTRDRHALAGTWGLVFSILLAFTGAFFSFATTLGLPVIAITAFAGDQHLALETIIGIPEAEDDTPKNFVGLEAIITNSQQEDVAGSTPIFIAVQHWGRADSRVITTHGPTAEGSMFFTNHRYDGVTGEYLGEKPGLGNVPSTGSTVIGLIGVLHFGWFAGLLSRIIWLSLGLAMCYVTLTGLQLWVQRREKSDTWQSLSRFISVIGYGLPFSMVTAAVGFLFSYSSSEYDVENWTVTGFLLGVVLSFIVGFVYPVAEQREKLFQKITGLGFISLPIIRLLTSEQSWAEYSHAIAVMSMDISLFITGLILLVLSTGIMRAKRFNVKASVETSATEPAFEAKA